jgi:N-acyl homoserine lactone hydrolase
MVSEQTRVYFICNGYIENDVALNVLMHNQGTADEPNKPGEWHRVPSISMLISHPQLGWILADTGSHKDAMNGYWPEAARKNSPVFRNDEDYLEARLAQVGLKPGDIDWLILTHLHLDHAGELRLFSNTKAGRRVIVHEQELKQGLYELFVHNQTLVNAYLKPDFVGLDGIKFEPVTGDTPLADDLELLWLPGHTAGLLGVMVHLQNSGTIIFMSDAAYVSENYGPPSRLPGILHDSVAFKASIEKVRWLERRYNAKVIFGHDLKQFQTLKHSPEFYD